MSETKTLSILQRVPVILAVTAASYGLALQPRDARLPQGSQTHGAQSQYQPAGSSARTHERR